MIPEIGHLSLILALCLALPLSIIPLWGAARGNLLWMSYSRPLATGQFLFVLFSFICLCNAFLADDFSVAYVAANSNTALPDQFKISAVWGAHEGSLLLWVLILAGWTLAVSVFSRHLPIELVSRVLSVMGMISVGFLLFVLLTSNPFMRHLPGFPNEGADLNPLLQDIGLVIHPPMLYMGYVGFSVAFAFAIAALLGGNLDAAWARWSRPWTNLAWVFLTIGIVLGSYWAYYELGWGGWWFWDPVENASFMPWLVGTALIHSLAVTDKRGVFKSWTLLLAIFAFSLSLLGTFLVRSGVLTSVHAFATDPERGLFILIFLVIVIGGSLTLYAFKAPSIVSKPIFKVWSREVLLLLNNVVLVAAAVTILLGTLYPLIIDALGLGRISVGPPYFNSVFVPLMSVLFVIIGLAPSSQWKSSPRKQLKRKIAVSAIASLTASLVLTTIYAQNPERSFEWGASLAVLFSAWIIISVVNDLYSKIKQSGQGLSAFAKFSRSYLGMTLAHTGIAVTIIGATFASLYSEQEDIRMQTGDSVEVMGYRFELAGVNRVQGPNYIADEATIKVFAGNEQLYLLKPQQRHYQAREQTMTEADIETGLTRDLYAALGEPLGGGAWAVSIHYKAFVDWIWFGGMFMALGGLLAVTDRRYRVRKSLPKQAEAPGVAVPAGVESSP